ASAGAAPSASASAKPSAPLSDRFAVAGGVVVERRPAEGADAPRDGNEDIITARAKIEILERGGRPGAACEVPPIAARPGELAAALERAAQGVRALVTDGGEAAVQARRRAGETTRQRLAKAPYGASWLALGDRLFGPGHPL